MVVFSVFSSDAAIKFFSDYPLSPPADSDFFVLQRNQSYICSTPAQVRQLWFTSPMFTGNGLITGTFTANSFIGDGSGLTGIPSGSVMTNYVNSVSNSIYLSLAGGFVANLNGFGTNESFYGTTFFTEIDALNFYPTNFFTGITNATLLKTDANGLLSATDFTAATNNDLAISNALFLQIQAGTNGTLANATNNDLLFGANATNHDWVIGSNATNNDTVISLAGSNNIIVLSNNVNSEISGALVSATNVLSGNGASVTNLTIRYNTNAIPTSGALTFGNAYFTNLQASVTLPAFTLGAAFYESLVICSTNSTGSDTTYTFPAGVAVALANGGSNKLTVTNKSRAMIFVDHYGTLMTNAWAVYY